MYGCQSSSNARSSEANRTLDPRRAQYRGLMPTGSRAATKLPSDPATRKANMPYSPPSASAPRWSISSSATSLSDFVLSVRGSIVRRRSSWL